MADGEENLFLDNLDEFIYDQDKIVTYKWLSRTLSVASNTAKQMLYAFLLKEKDKKRNRLSATYIIGGRCMVDNQLVHQYILTSDDNLEETKRQFELVTSVHVYSLQKKIPKDINILYTVDYEIQQEHKDECNKWSNIYCTEAERLSDGGASRGCSMPKPGKENAEPKSPETKNGLGSSNAKTDASKSKPSNQRPKKGQLPSLGMFAVKTEKKPDCSNSIADSDKKEKPSIQTEKSKPSAMLSFFGKQISEPPKCTPQTKEEPKDKPKEKYEDKTPIATKDIKKSPDNTTSSKPTKQTRRRIKNLSSSDEEEDPIPKSLKKLVSDSESEEDKKTRSKGKNKQDKGKLTEKKREIKKETVKKASEETQVLDKANDKKAKTSRKRKKEDKDESSEDSLESSTNRTIIGETPTINQKPAARRRKRQKVMRSKTYVDEDGFMVTEKVYESESTDASDEETVQVKQDTQPSPVSSKNSSPDSKPKKQIDLKPAKQASLMSFFKKH